MQKRHFCGTEWHFGDTKTALFGKHKMSLYAKKKSPSHLARRNGDFSISTLFVKTSQPEYSIIILCHDENKRRCET